MYPNLNSKMPWHEYGSISNRGCVHRPARLLAGVAPLVAHQSPHPVKISAGSRSLTTLVFRRWSPVEDEEEWHDLVGDDKHSHGWDYRSR